jgi:hypothetical protein
MVAEHVATITSPYAMIPPAVLARKIHFCGELSISGPGVGKGGERFERAHLSVL